MSEPMQQIETIFNAARAIPAGASRSAYLDQACGGDAAMRREVDLMLSAASAADGFFAEKPIGLTALDQTVVDPHAAPPRLLTEGPGTQLGHYKLLEKIGEGGFGVVYLADQKAPVKRRVALKIIKLGMDTEQVVARFEAERQALAMMDHPNIAKVLDAGSTETGRPYFVMELVRGIAITKFCDEGNLSMPERLELFMTACHAIQHAHQKGIIHRDIKPSNVLVTMHDDKPVVKVIDFGIAKATQQELTEKTAFTQFQQFIGTPAYMSPEQAGMSGLDIDTRSDVYSLGVLLYELLTGSTPMDVRDLTTGGYDEMRRRIKEVEAPKPSTRISSLNEADLTTMARRRRSDPHRLKRQLRGDLDRVILKALEKDRTRRYETATAFAEDIRRYLNHEPVTAVPPTALYLFTRYARRHKASLAMAASIGLTLIVSASYSVAQAVKAGRAAAAARAAEQLKSIALGSAEQERDRATQMAVRLDSANDQLKRAATRAEFTTGDHFIESDQLPKGIAHLARSLRTDPGYWPAAARLISTLTDRGFALDDLPPLTHDGPIYERVLDRNTGLLATRGENYDLRIWNAWKAEPLMSIGASGNRKMPSLSRDGRRLLYLDTNGTAQVFEPFSNPRTPLASLRAAAPIVEAVLSPASGPGLKAATRLGDGTVQLWNAESGASLGPPLRGTSTNGGFLAFTKDGQRVVASFADGSVGVWPVPPQTGSARRLAAATSSVLALAPDSGTLVERAADHRSVRFWDLAAGAARGGATALNEPLARVPGERGAVPLGTSHGHLFEFSEDGRRMVAVSHGTFQPYANVILHPKLEIHLFDVAAGKLLHTTSATNVTHHEENLVAGLGAMVLHTNRLVIRSLATGATLMDRSWPTDAIQTTKFSPAGDRILVALTDRRLILFDARTGESLTHAGDPAHISNVAGGSGRAAGQTYFMRHSQRVARLEFSPEGDVFVTHAANGSLQHWDTFEGLPLSEPVPNSAGEVDFSADGRWLLVLRQFGGQGATRYDSGSIRAIGRDFSAARHRPLPYSGWAPVLHFSADGRYGLVGSGGLTVFHPETGETIRRIEAADTGKIGLVGSITWLISEAWFSPSGDRIVAICHADTTRVVKVFETATGKILHTLPTPRMSQPFRVRFAGDNRVVIGSWVYEDGVMPLQVWDLPSMRVVAAAKPAAGPYIFDVSPDGRRIASCDSGIALIDGSDLRPIGPVLRHRAPDVGLYAIAFSPDSRRLVTGSMDGTVRVWKAETGDLEGEFEHGDWPRWVGVSADSQRVVATGRGAYDVPSAANVWEFAGAESRRVTSSLIQPNTIVHAMFSADSRYLVAGDRGGLVRLWDLETSLPVLNPLFVDGQGGVSRVGINHRMSRVFAVTFGGQQLHHRPLPPRDLAVPDWLPQLAEAVAGQRINDRGALEALDEKHLREVKTLVAQLPTQADGDNFYARWAHWFFDDRSTRAVAPLSSFTVPDEVNERLQNGSLASLRAAHHISPTDARVFAALARETAAHEALRPIAPLDPEAWSASEWYARQAVERAPDSVEAHWSHAEVLLRLDRPDAARAALTHAIRVQADDPNVLALRSELARRVGETNEAHTLLARALNAPAPKTASAYLQLASIARHSDFFAEASLRNRTERRLAGRALNLPSQFIDVTPWYNGPVGGAQTNAAKAAPGFDAPVMEVGGIPFDLRGVMAFSTVPTRNGDHKAVLGIAVGQRCARLHFHAGGAAHGLQLRVHFADNQTLDFPLALTREDSVVAWDNPRPEVSIRTVDLIARPNTEPRVAAITAQTGPDPVLVMQPQTAYPRVPLGQPFELRVEVSPAGSWIYQWNANHQPIAGATNPILRVANATAKDLGRYQVEVRSAANDPACKPVRSRPLWPVDAASPILRGVVKEELYLNASGSLEDLIKSPNFPNRPDAVEHVKALEAPQIPQDNFGRRLSGWLVPKESASYTFYLCSDDASRLSLSSDEAPGKLVEIARLSGYVGEPRHWQSLGPESISKPIRLEAGKRYFIEVLHKEGGGGDHVSVAWRKDGDPAPKNGDAPIGAEFLTRSAD
jgi:serine/threonine protein kinase/WD40 repeat protein